MPETMKQLLRDHGLQVTAQRLAIMRVVARRPHATADEVTADVRAVLGSISRQAVYDTLSALVARNLLRRIQPAGAAARYEDRVGDNHHHLICRACDRVVDIDCSVGAQPCLALDDDRGFAIDEAEVVYWGYCPDCRASDAATARPTRGKPRHGDDAGLQRTASAATQRGKHHDR